MMKIAILGTRGIPNNYGGFETLTEYLVEYLSKEFEITVFCSSKDISTKMDEYNGAKLKYLPISSHGGIGIIYDSISLILSVRKYDKILFLGFGGGLIIPFLKMYSHKIILNIGGLDWKRNKWSPKAKKVIKLAEKLLVQYTDRIISDNRGIQDYLLKEYGKASSLIAYGGDQVKKINITPASIIEYPFLKTHYAFIVTRIQEDNNIEMLLKSFLLQRKMPLVMVGNWDNSPYGKKIKSKFENETNLILLDAIYDRQKLDILRSNCTIYVHGHSAGGTNPSLVEAMYLGLPVFAFASGYNEYTTFNKAKYFKNENELVHLIETYETQEALKIGHELKKLAEKHYIWADIANEYKKVILNR